MIVLTKYNVKDVAAQGKGFNWCRLKCCKKCKSKVWGHGFVYRFFNGIINAVPIKRWICSSCGTVYVCVPVNYWTRYQESISKIFKFLIYRVTHHKWPPETTRQRGGHWMNKLINNAKINKLFKDSMIETITFYQEKSLSIS